MTDTEAYAWARPHWDRDYVRRVALFRWDAMPRCARCGAEPGAPCIDQRNIREGWALYRPHRGRSGRTQGERTLRWSVRCESPDCGWHAKAGDRDHAIELGRAHAETCSTDEGTWSFRVLGIAPVSA